MCNDTEINRKLETIGRITSESTNFGALCLSQKFTEQRAPQLATRGTALDSSRGLPSKSTPAKICFLSKIWLITGVPYLWAACV